MKKTSAASSDPLSAPGVSTAGRAKFWSRAGWALLALWAAWWAANILSSRFRAGGLVLFDPWDRLGLDFMHNYRAARLWLHGGNPYTQDFGDPRGLYAYPPLVLPLFAWCGLVSLPAGAAIWAAFTAGVATAVAALAQQVRRAAGLTDLPTPLVVALALLALPVMFSMERGNYDALVLLLVAAAAIALTRSGETGGANDARDADGAGGGDTAPRPVARLAWEVLAGLLMALAVWVKLYPVLIIPAAWALRYRRAAVLAAVFFVFIGAATLEPLQQWERAAAQTQWQRDRLHLVGAVGDWVRGRGTVLTARDAPAVEPFAHSLSNYWTQFWLRAGVGRLARVPGVVGAAALLAPLALWTAWAARRAVRPQRWTLAALLWAVALVTFWVPVSYDYNGLFLVLAALAVWDRCDPRWVQAALLALLVLWWQPLAIARWVLTPEGLLWVKTAGLIAVTACLVRRLREARGT